MIDPETCRAPNDEARLLDTVVSWLVGRMGQAQRAPITYPAAALWATNPTIGSMRMTPVAVVVTGAVERGHRTAAVALVDRLGGAVDTALMVALRVAPCTVLTQESGRIGICATGAFCLSSTEYGITTRAVIRGHRLQRRLICGFCCHRVEAIDRTILGCSREADALHSALQLEVWLKTVDDTLAHRRSAQGAAQKSKREARACHAP